MEYRNFEVVNQYKEGEQPDFFIARDKDNSERSLVSKTKNGILLEIDEYWIDINDMRDDSYLIGHPEWINIVKEADRLKLLA